MSTEPLDRLVAEVGDRLTPTERRLAAVVVDDPKVVAFGTVADVAALVDTSGPTVVRFATKLGFEGYSALQDHVRADLAERLARPADRLAASAGAAAAGVTDAVHRGVASALAADPDRLAAVAARLATADGVWLLSGESSRAGAAVLAAGLALLRPGVRRVDDPEDVTALADAGPDSVAVVVDFRRYRRSVVRAAQRLCAAGVHVVAVSDGPLSPLVAHAHDWFAIDVPAVGPFDSAVPPVVLAELLLAAVADELSEASTDRIERLEASWDAAGALVDE